MFKSPPVLLIDEFSFPIKINASPELLDSNFIGAPVDPSSILKKVPADEPVIFTLPANSDSRLLPDIVNTVLFPFCNSTLPDKPDATAISVVDEK